MSLRANLYALDSGDENDLRRRVSDLENMLAYVLGRKQAVNPLLLDVGALNGSQGRIVLDNIEGEGSGYALFEREVQEVFENLITSNPGFELGDFTGFSAHTNWSIISSTAYEGTYAARGGATVDPITTDKYAVTAGLPYKFSLWSRGYTNPFWIVVYVNFYDATPTLIGTQTIAINQYIGLDWTEVSGRCVAPAGCTQAEITAELLTGVSQDIVVDAFEIIELANKAYLRLEAGGPYLGDEVEEANALGLPQSDFRFASQMKTSVTVVDTVDPDYKHGFYRGPTSANSADGQEYLFEFILAAGTYELRTYGNANLNCGIVDYYLDESDTPFSGAQDWYAASAGTPTEKTITGVFIETGGRHVLKVKVNGKSGLNYYRWLPTALWFVRTDPFYTVKATPPEEEPETVAYRLMNDGASYRLMNDGVSKRLMNG